MILFGRTQDCYGTPFDPTDPDAVAAGISANTAQKAIIEAKADALNNDRYPFQAQYGGNANAGRYLEIFTGLASYPDAPFIFPENSAIRTISVGFKAASTCVIGFYKTTDLVNPVFTLSPTGVTRVLYAGLNYGFSANDELAIKIISGSGNSPFLRVWVNTTT